MRRHSEPLLPPAISYSQEIIKVTQDFTLIKILPIIELLKSDFKMFTTEEGHHNLEVNK